eukprot:1304394-Prymnesium_polylepis.1
MLEETEALLHIARLTRHVMLGTDKEADVKWAGPVGKPHTSLAYTDQLTWLKRLRLKLWWGSPASSTLREGFVATELVLMETRRREPNEPLVPFVHGWREVARVPLTTSSGTRILSCGPACLGQ